MNVVREVGDVHLDGRRHDVRVVHVAAGTKNEVEHVGGQRAVRQLAICVYEVGVEAVLVLEVRILRRHVPRQPERRSGSGIRSGDRRVHQVRCRVRRAPHVQRVLDHVLRRRAGGDVAERAIVAGRRRVAFIGNQTKLRLHGARWRRAKARQRNGDRPGAHRLISVEDGELAPRSQRILVRHGQRPTGKRLRTLGTVHVRHPVTAVGCAVDRFDGLQVGGHVDHAGEILVCRTRNVDVELAHHRDGCGPSHTSTRSSRHLLVVSSRCAELYERLVGRSCRQSDSNAGAADTAGEVERSVEDGRTGRKHHVGRTGVEGRNGTATQLGRRCRAVGINIDLGDGVVAVHVDAGRGGADAGLPLVAGAADRGVGRPGAGKQCVRSDEDVAVVNRLIADGERARRSRGRWCNSHKDDRQQRSDEGDDGNDGQALTGGVAFPRSRELIGNHGNCNRPLRPDS